MDWTKEPPNPEKPSWHWHAYDRTEFYDLPEALYAPHMFYAYRDHGGVVHVVDPINDEDYAIAAVSGLWAGPIEPPPLP